MNFKHPFLCCITKALPLSFCPCPAHGSISPLLKLKQNVGPFPSALQCWGGLQIKKLSPGRAHQAVQHCSPGRFTTYILFYGPFLIHHNTASILLTSPSKHTSFPPAISLFLSLCSYPYSTTLHQVLQDVHRKT